MKRTWRCERCETCQGEGKTWRAETQKYDRRPCVATYCRKKKEHIVEFCCWICPKEDAPFETYDALLVHGYAKHLDQIGYYTDEAHKIRQSMRKSKVRSVCAICLTWDEDLSILYRHQWLFHVRLSTFGKIFAFTFTHSQFQGTEGLQLASRRDVGFDGRGTNDMAVSSSEDEEEEEEEEEEDSDFVVLVDEQTPRNGAKAKNKSGKNSKAKPKNSARAALNSSRIEKSACEVEPVVASSSTTDSSEAKMETGEERNASDGEGEGESPEIPPPIGQVEAASAGGQPERTEDASKTAKRRADSTSRTGDSGEGDPSVSKKAAVGDDDDDETRNILRQIAQLQATLEAKRKEQELAALEAKKERALAAFEAKKKKFTEHSEKVFEEARALNDRWELIEKERGELKEKESAWKRDRDRSRIALEELKAREASLNKEEAELRE